MIDCRRRDNLGQDDISAVLGDCRYATPHYDKALRDTILGIHSRQLVPVSRFYMLLKPPVIVDFEPQAGAGPFWVDQKRAYFHGATST